VHHHVESARNLIAHSGVRQPDSRHEGERLDPPQRIGRRVGVHGRERAVVAGVQRLEHVERLRAPHLANHDPVGPHAQRVHHELPDRDLAAALEIRRARLEPHHVPLPQPQLGGVLDRDDALLARDRPRERVQRRRLARAGPAAHENGRPRGHAQRE
jgi:hypothetical protein